VGVLLCNVFNLRVTWNICFNLKFFALMIKKPPTETKKEGYKEPKNLILIFNPFEALTIYSALEYIEDRKDIKKSLKESIRAYKKQIEDHITNEQIEDAHAEFATRHLLGKY
jgi:hypothetical protein